MWCYCYSAHDSESLHVFYFFAGNTSFATTTGLVRGLREAARKTAPARLLRFDARSLQSLHHAGIAGDCGRHVLHLGLALDAAPAAHVGHVLYKVVHDALPHVVPANPASLTLLV